MNKRMINQIDAEMKRQDEKWGANRNLIDLEWLAILVGDVGEASEAILKGLPAQIETDVIHIAAVAIQWLEDIQRLE